MKALPLNPEPSLAAERLWSAELRRLLSECASGAAHADAACRDAIRDEDRTILEADRLLREAYEAEYAELQGRLAAEHAELTARWDAAEHGLETHLRESLSAIDQRAEAELTAARQQRDEARWLVSSVLDENAADSPLQLLQRLQDQITGAEAQLQESVAQGYELRRRAMERLDRCRMGVDWPVIDPPVLPDNIAQLQERCVEAAQGAEQPYKRLMRQWLPRLFSGFAPVFVFLFIAAALAVPVLLFVEPEWIGMEVARDDVGWRVIVSVSAGAIALVTMFLLHVIASQRAAAAIVELAVSLATMTAALERWRRVSQQQLAEAHRDFDQRHALRQQKRNEALSRAEDDYARIAGDVSLRRQAEARAVQEDVERQRVLQRAQRDQEFRQQQAAAQQAQRDFLVRRDADFQQLAAEYQSRRRGTEETRAAELAAWHARWTAGFRELAATTQRWRDEFAPVCPPWGQILQQRAAATNERPPALALGRLRIVLHRPEDVPPTLLPLEPLPTELSLPLAWKFGEKPGLLLKVREEGRAAGIRVLQAAMLRLLTALPPGKVRLTILDPAGLGENFAAFMHLADVDELLITSRIWTEPSQIEERLADLTEHMETVLQMFLRNEFPTLEDYNRQAGEVAEPYRVLVVANLPANFSDIALRRLWSIVTSGARCGVIPLISVDVTQPLPRNFALRDLAEQSVVLHWQDGEFRVEDEELGHWPLAWEEPPEASLQGELVKWAGRQAGDVRRVEVPFQRVAPAPDAVWTRSSARGLDVPMGRAGATKLQSLALGSGTSQHVLIAGKTGSGKSTLLHALITNAALHYSPDELEFYLIDFKKGVEFKVYARRRLPHARVIAIESDREFGVSVLARLDGVLQERSNLFRDAGVQDLAGFRQARPDQPLPRILLIVDEFQEFFIEDDPLAQTAGLLLDRLIRQGRAFGVHVILGSQTLAGAYSLARSTLGQVAVRIALQCSETDAHLILSEENTAARLLTRPGEAIYNDANGLVAGNHLFQVVWLDDALREQYLGELDARAGATGRRPPPAIVFEGNVPADLSLLPAWRSPATAATNGAPVTAWVGEAVSLQGSLGLEFAAAAGGNLLIVGQDEAAACGVITACSLSVARQAAPGAGGLWIANGSPTAATATTFRELAATTPAVELLDFADLEARLQELVEEVRRREGQPGPRIWLCLFDLVRFRKLRKSDDEFGFGGFDRKGAAASPSQLLAEILRDGPPAGVHVWLWCDSANTVNRWLSRDMQQQLENRVVFAMNATDSSQLIDSPAASRLGPHRAWLFRGDRGTLDKFRPYHPPPAGWLEQHAAEGVDATAPPAVGSSSGS